MKRTVMVVLAAVLVVSMISISGAKDLKKEQVRFYRPNYEETGLDIPGYEPRPMLTAAAADTYCVVWYDFESQDWQSWTQVDNTAQKGTFFHVDDFAGLGGGTFGRLVPIEGDKSVWCGARPTGGDYACSWESAPGYGNNWIQCFEVDAFTHELGLLVSYHIVNDTESEWDFVYFEHSDWYDDGGYNWEIQATYNGVIDTVVTHEISTARARSKLRFRFQSDYAYSDEDGLHDTDGACIIDSITIADNSGVLEFDDFESYASGDTSAGNWFAYEGNDRYWDEMYGIYSGLAMGLQSKDPCGYNFSTVVMFFKGSPYPSQDYPGLFETPYCTGAGGIEKPCQREMIVSPPIDLTRYSTGRDNVQDAAIPPGDLPTLGGLRLEHAIYSDNPMNSLVFRTHAIRNIENGCAGAWIGPNLWFPYEPTGWWTSWWDISSIVTSDTIQVSLGIADMCSEWYGVYGNCEDHTPAPWYDNVRIRRWDNSGPQWSVRAYDLFQDTFPQDVPGSPDPMEEFCRADMANDIAPGDEFYRIDPGDSAVVTVAAPNSGGLDTLGTGEARVYFHCDVQFLGLDGKPDIAGAQLTGTYGSYVSDIGNWTIFLCEPAATSAGNIAPDKYCIDLNDSLFTRGYMIEYYFKAYDAEGNSSTYPEDAEQAGGKRYEFTCLPTLRRVPGALFVDDYHGRGTFEGTVETYWNYVFGDSWPCCVAPPYDSIPPDRYDVNGPSSGVCNGVGAYTSVTEPVSIFSQAYEMVIIDSGDLASVTISEGTDNSDKSNDAQLLVDWMDRSEHKVGLLVMGDNTAYDLSGSYSVVAIELMSTKCGVTLENSSYFNLTGGHSGGGDMNPLVTGVSGSLFDGLEYYLSGGCPIIKDFDVLEVTGLGQYALQYPEYNSLPHYAGIYTDQLNDATQPLRTVWAGHSLMNMRNTGPAGVIRKEFVVRVNEFFERIIWGVDSEIPAVTSLTDNFPNPFNPSTRLKFSLSKKGHVSMRVYDVSGRLICILVDEVREAGSYEVVWDGANDGGRSTASGIYFCRMEAPGYERTLKMVLLR